MSDERDLPYDFSNCDMKTMSKTRESGFYWVKYPHGVWMIAMYTDPIGWATFHGDPEEYPSKDHEFIEIDERRIVREEVKHER